jgi:LysR family transcriptional regulator (chromosome initiation inhibitor)
MLARTTPPQATSAGQKLIKHYLQVKRLEDDLMGEIDKVGSKGFTSIAVGINADSLAFWLLEAIHPFLLEEMVLLDIRVNDQEKTHQLLKDGEVMGCIGTIEQPLQGCRIEYIGRMNYRMMAAPKFAADGFLMGLQSRMYAVPPPLFSIDRTSCIINFSTKPLRKFLPQSRPITYLPLKNLLNSSPWGLPMVCCRISKARH